MQENNQGKSKNNTASIIVGLLCLLVVVGILVFPNSSNKSKNVGLSEYSSVNSICELATLKSFYHNVVVYEKKPEGAEKILNDVLLWPFGNVVKIGYKQLWLEYSGIVETGIDASQVIIHEPDINGVVEVFVPDAKVLNVYADEMSLSEPLSESGLFTTISGKEKMDAFTAAQNAMKQEAENDQSLKKRSKENAKRLLEQYIINMGKEMGTVFSVKWFDIP